MKKKLLFAAIALTAMASCTEDSFVGEQSQQEANESSGAIVFNSSFKTLTRADHVGADAADMLGGKFYVGGYKNNGSSYTPVFDNYKVEWGANTAGTTTDNTSDWKYVSVISPGFAGHISGEQTIKYWDFAASYYDFVAYSPGKNQNIIITGTPSTNNILATAINPTALTSAAYTLIGSADDLAECYIADMITAKESGATTPDINYKDEVSIKFRRLGSKVRVALYETIPGYSVRDVKFYTDASTTTETGTSVTNTTLFTSEAKFYPNGTMTVKFPTIGTSNKSNSDYNKAHVTFAGDGTATSTKAFGGLNYETTPGNWEDSRLNYTSNPNTYLKRTSKDPSFAGTAPYYLTVLPDETGNVLELRVDYTLESIDGSKETITVHGATAFVPQIYAAWKPNYAYTYIFKISDNTNGWTKATGGTEGLYPITLDAVVADSQDGTQSTITTVATPSITTYMKGHKYDTDGPEYKAGSDSIYIRVMDGATLKTDLNTNGKLYTVTGDGLATMTEANVMDALNVRTSGTATTVVGRNGFTLTPATEQVATGDETFGTIPGADGNNIPSIAANTATRFLATAGTYAYVYDYTTGDPETRNVITAVVSASAPDGWNASSNIYYEDAECTTPANYAYKNTTVVLSSEPADWNASDNVYYTDAECTNPANTAYANGTYYKKGVYYRKYTNQNRTYSVKVIRVVSGS